MHNYISALSSLIIALVISVVPSLAHAGISGFGDFSNFTINKGGLDSGLSPNIFPGKIEITDNSGSETRSIFYNTPQTISTFTAAFTYQEVNGSNAPTQGVAFVLQNTNQGPNAVAAAGSFGFGYNGLVGIAPGSTKSAAISLELSSPTGTSLYTGGSVTLGGANHTSPVNLLSGDPINVSLSYNGPILQETVSDPLTSASSSFSYLVNLPQILGGTTAYVGFTAQTPAAIFGFVPDQQYISNLQFNAVPEPSALMLLGTGLTTLISLRYRPRS
jgi:hypothetical protein